MATRADRINKEIDMMLEGLSIDPQDPELRLIALEGLRDGWKEDLGDSIEKSLWMMTLNALISTQKMKVHFAF